VNSLQHRKRTANKTLRKKKYPLEVDDALSHEWITKLVMPPIFGKSGK
jgi:hypothetical protein